MPNLSVTCGSIDGIKYNLFGYCHTLKVQLNDVEVDSLLEQIGREKLEARLAELNQSGDKPLKLLKAG